MIPLSINIYLLSTFRLPGARDTVVNETDSVPVLMECQSSGGRESNLLTAGVISSCVIRTMKRSKMSEVLT